MARRLGFKDLLSRYEGGAIRLGGTLVLREQNAADLRANALERQHDLRRWRTKKSRNEHVFFFEGTRRRRRQLVYEGIKLEALVGHLRDELRETARKLQDSLA